ncbi:MAG TPA: RNB domain-containing ribonuclease, partial [Sphingomicrobium sp.]
MTRKPSPGLPSRKQILDFIAGSGQPAGKREIARAFGIRGNDKIALKKLLNDMGDEGLIETSRGRAFHQVGGIPKVTVLKVVEADEDGAIWARPENWEADTPPPKLRVIEKGRHSALGIGDRVLARTEARGKGYVAHPLKTLVRQAELVLGVLRKEGSRFWLTPVEKKERRELPVSDVKEGEAGDLVLCEVSGRGPRVTAKVDAVLGDPFAPKSFSLIAIHKYELPHEFSNAVIEEAKRVAKQPLGEREDLTHLPIVAIDPADARDHDDAIWAQADGEGGWDAIIAIADVSFYVRPGSELDRSARARGNSVYFPDRVVPMLPEGLSADICSLKAGKERAALACHLKVAKDGTLKSWRFSRAKICVAANIAYEDAQAAIDISIEERVDVTSPVCFMPEVEGPVPNALVEKALKPL